jgi:hypothetical protein
LTRYLTTSNRVGLPNWANVSAASSNFIFSLFKYF